LENLEFVIQSSENYFLADLDSEASGKYDLLTTVLHELSHLYGFIEGYSGFDNLVLGEREMVKGERKNNTFAPDPLTFNQGEALFDGEHLDKQAHPYDLLNTHLSPGMRKLPSELDVEILQALIATEFEKNGSKPAGEELLAKLTSDPLLAINNGDFSTSDTTTNSFVWDTRGASGIEDGQAILTEDSPFLSNSSQTFTVSESAKTIQFKLIETELGASELAPPDAFEVALLDAKTNESLTSDTDLTQTDSLLNIQPDGTAHFSDQVKIGGATSGDVINLDKSRTVTVDISDLTPGTEATLYFDLLGFGDVDSRIVIDDVRLSDQNLLPPIAQSDRTTTSQGKPVVIDILANDSDDDGAIAPESIRYLRSR
jgi:large repetitive protein